MSLGNAYNHLLFKGILFGHRCEHCQSENTVHLHAEVEIFTLGPIPTLPIGKIAHSHCVHCQVQHSHHNFPPLLQQHYDSIKKDSRVPIWTFMGSFLFVGVIALIIIASFVSRYNVENKDKAELIEFISEPKPEDQYIINTLDNRYQLFRVNKVFPTYLEVHYHRTIHSQWSYFNGVKLRKDFFDQAVMLPRGRIIRMYQADKIHRIDREPPNIYMSEDVW